MSATAIDIDDEETKQPERQSSNSSIFQQLSSGLQSLMKRKKNAKPGKEETDDSEIKLIADLCTHVRSQHEPGALHEEQSLTDIFETLKSYKDLVQAVANKYVADIDLTKLTPAHLIYYLEYEDERKHVSYRNRLHRFCSSVKLQELEDLFIPLQLAYLSYADTAQEIESALKNGPIQGTVLYINLQSQPAQPACFLAVRSDQDEKPLTEPLEVLMVIRGTKSVADALTDALCDAVPYRDGHAHEYILKAGLYCYQRYQPLLMDALAHSGRPKLKLLLVGHSLGAGAASICGMELHERDHIDVEVIGFGCPALLSKELAEKCQDYITTVVNDNDVIPRTSAATITNILLDLTVCFVVVSVCGYQ